MTGSVMGQTIGNRLCLLLVIIATVALALLGSPKKILAQTAGTVCAARADTSDAEAGVMFNGGLQGTFDLSSGVCSTGSGMTNSYNPPGFAGADGLFVINNVDHSGVTYTAGISVVVGTNVSNLLLDGAPYTEGTQIPLTVAGAFSGTFRFDFGGNSFQFSIVKPAASDTIQGFTIEAFVAPAADSPLLTQRVINNFMVRRADQIVTNRPDLTERLTGGSAGGPAVGITGNGEGGTFSVAFATDMRRIASAYTADAIPLADAPGTMSSGAIPSGTTGPVDGFDLWVEGAWSRLDGSGAINDLALFHIGADYRFSDDMVIGVLGQFDWSDEENDAMNTQVDGFGWMTGPYIAARLHEHLILDARATWGRSYNDVSPTGTYTDSFETERWLVSGGIAGSIHLGNWHLTPGVSAAYFRERQDSYTDGLGMTIPGQTVSLGRLSFGPEVAYRYQPSGNWMIAPQIGVRGIWNFADTEVVDLATGTGQGTNDLRARAEGSVTVTYDERYTLTADGFFDGFGANDYDAFGGSLAINILIADGVQLSGQSFVSISKHPMIGGEANSIGGINSSAGYGATVALKWQL